MEIKRKGAAEVIHRCWADEPECTGLDDSLNFGNRDYLGAHTRLERRPDQNKDPMSLVMAADFVRKLLAQWITSKLAKQNGSRSKGSSLKDSGQPAA